MATTSSELLILTTLWFYHRSGENCDLTKFNPILPGSEPNPGVQLRDIADNNDFAGISPEAQIFSMSELAMMHSSISQMTRAAFLVTNPDNIV